MKRINVQSLNECLGIDGPNFIIDDQNCIEELTSSNFIGNKHPLYGTNRTEEQKQNQSETIRNWWKSISEDKKEEMRKNSVKVISSQWSSLTSEERKTARNWKVTPKNGKNNPNYGKVSANRGKVWITNGTDNKLVNIDYLTNGWWKGRTINNTDR
jgi:hypothetical protein